MSDHQLPGHGAPSGPGSMVERMWTVWFIGFPILLVGAIVWYVVVSQPDAATERRERLEEVVDERYVEDVALVQGDGGSWSIVVVIDQDRRDDCTVEDGGHLECDDRPRPRLADRHR